MKRILTADEYILRSVSEHPSLYASPSSEESKFRVLDHILNTIGNGADMASFEGIPLTKKKVSATQKWFRCERAAYGYTKTKEIGSGEFKWTVPDGDYKVVAPVDELSNYPEIIHWVEFDTGHKRDPYPNFSKKYSAVWDKGDVKFEALGKEWAEAAIWYYEKCQEYFSDPRSYNSYHSAFPCDTEDKTNRTIKDYMSYIGSVDKYPTNNAITEAYECEFIGDRTNKDDVAAFITRRWEKEHKRILDFIEDTLTRLRAYAS